LKEQTLVCTKLKTKFNSYSSSHISVTEDVFSLINNTGVWPSGCLIAPNYDKLMPYRGTPDAGALPATGKSAVDPAGNDGANGGMAHVSDASTGGSAMSNPNLGNSLGIYYQNVRGLSTKQLELYNNVWVANFDLICLSETWLNGQCYDHNSYPHGYTVYRFDRA
jgi:hypothetical protein